MTTDNALKHFDLVRFAHEKDGGPVHRVVSVMSDGMIELHDMGGYFAPHLFVVANTIAAPTPPSAPGVRVRVLIWEDADEGMCTKWRAEALGGSYDLVAFEGEDGFAVNFSWGRPLSFWFIQGEPDDFGYPSGPKMFPTLEAAKAAAQADCERRILSALEPSPQPIADGGWRVPTVRVGEQIEWLKARLAMLQLPEKDHHRREEWLVELGMPEIEVVHPEEGTGS